jgi:hypothetical protein
MSLYWSNTTNSKVNGGDNSEVDKASEVISIICQKIKDSKVLLYCTKSSTLLLFLNKPVPRGAQRLHPSDKGYGRELST